MLRKLYKYDFRCSARKIVPIYALFYALSIMLLIVSKVDVESLGVIGNMIGGLVEFGFVALCFGLVFGGFGYSLARFKKNLFTDEGYLMHTLPVKPSKLILSKLFNAFTWGILSGLVILSGMFIVGFVDFGEIKALFSLVKLAFSDFDVAIITLLNLFTIFLGFVAIILVVIFSTVAENSFKVLKKPVVSIAVIFFFVFALTLLGDLLGTIIMKILDAADLSEIARLIIGISLVDVITIGFILACYFASCYLMKNKLNLE